MLEIRADMAANVWKVLVKVGEDVSEDQHLLVLESMKMEIPVLSPAAGRIVEVRVSESISVGEGDVLVVLAENQ